MITKFDVEKVRNLLPEFQKVELTGVREMKPRLSFEFNELNFGFPIDSDTTEVQAAQRAKHEAKYFLDKAERQFRLK